MKITWCHNRLAIGNAANGDIRPEATSTVLDTLHEAGVTHLINCRRDPEYVRDLQVLRGVGVLWNPTDDDGEPKPVEWFAKSIDFALIALATPYKKVCVCCYNGNNRAPSTALAILMAQGLKREDALELILNERPTAEILYSRDAERAVKELGYR